MRLNKYLADQNIASRREADALINAGLVFINGKRAALGVDVKPTDKVTLRENRVKTLAYFAYHKPKGVDSVTGFNPDAEIPKGVALVGRLDKDASGLMIATNDGRLTRRLIGPQSKIDQEYRLIIDKKITPWFMRHLTAKLNAIALPNSSTTLHQLSEDTLSLILIGNSKAPLKHFITELEASLKTLHRLRIGPIRLSSLKSGQVRELTPDEIQTLLN